ncbi:hypothetical protein SCUCBS95973_000536 [Sporothrix curviconia]|uniref:Ig-like domain-containing protein n=1 Tax=Sporothrix curviconia TaxID=1260050 RepID=A0ABP0ARB3_9PEZI
MKMPPVAGLLALALVFVDPVAASRCKPSSVAFPTPSPTRYSSSSLSSSASPSTSSSSASQAPPCSPGPNVVLNFDFSNSINGLASWTPDGTVIGQGSQGCRGMAHCADLTAGSQSASLYQDVSGLAVGASYLLQFRYFWQADNSQANAFCWVTGKGADGQYHNQQYNIPNLGPSSMWTTEFVIWTSVSTTARVACELSNNADTAAEILFTFVELSQICT